MIPFMDSEEEEVEKCLDSQLWHACAGGMVQLPSVNSLVYYFPQGHAEHSNGNVDFRNLPRIPAYALCRVLGLRFMAEEETDEVYAKIRLVPVPAKGNDEIGLNCSDEGLEKPASFAKTLTQSDANNGGGFSVPRYCAETIFPRLDYSADPPVQTILVKDVHGEVWKFRHIYRGTPRRHLLTTGWSSFVSQKKLVAGDSIVFLRAENGDLCVGIRRAKRGIFGESQSASGWNPAGGNCSMPYGGLLSSFLQDEEENKKMLDCSSSGAVKGKVRTESVLEAARLAADGQPFEIVYYPRASTPEFCVKATFVNAALRVRWCSGMRFKMPFETEDSSRISWFMGTVSSVQVEDPIRWPNSPWRLLQVSWDEPDLLQNVKRVSPWLVELVSNMPAAVHLSPFSPPRKKLRLPQHQEIQMNGQLPLRTFSGSLLGPDSPFSCLDTIPAGMQGARHAPFSASPYLSSPYVPLPPIDRAPKQFRNFSCSGPNNGEDASCSLTIRSAVPEAQKSASPFILFGRTIFTEQQVSVSCSGDVTNNGRQQEPETETELGTGLCKIFIESEENVGDTTLDLSLLTSYEDLYKKLRDMVGKESSKSTSQVRYRDETGAVKNIGDERFSDFIKTAKQLIIRTDSTANIDKEALRKSATNSM